MEADKIVPKIRLSPKFGVCAGGNSEIGAGNIFPAHYKECSLENHDTTMVAEDCHWQIFLHTVVLFENTFPSLNFIVDFH